MPLQQQDGQESWGCNVYFAKQLSGCCNSTVSQQQAVLHHQSAQALSSSTCLSLKPAHSETFGILLLPNYTLSMASQQLHR